MKKLIRQALFRLPQYIKNPIIRSQVKVTNTLEKENIQVLVAEDKTDFETAFQLLHESYFDSGLMDKHPSGLRCNSYSFLPHTTIIILKKDGIVIGTVSLIRDSAMGLPSDEKYKFENDSLRVNGRVLTEVSALAIDKNFRNQGHILSLLLMKYLYIYSKRHSDTEYLVCTVHPRAEDFYRALWGFVRKGKIVSYDYVKGALAVYMSMYISPEAEKALYDSYHSADPTVNLVHFCLMEDKRFHYPQYQQGQILNIKMTPEILNYFFNVRTNLFADLNEFHKKMFYEIYYYHFGKEVIDTYFPPRTEKIIREFRTPTRINAKIMHENKFVDGVILDLSSSGCYVSLSSKSRININDNFELKFNLGDKDFSLKGSSVWMNSGENNRLPIGVGVKFEVSMLQLALELKKWMKRHDTKNKQLA